MIEVKLVRGGWKNGKGSLGTLGVDLVLPVCGRRGNSVALEVSVACGIAVFVGVADLSSDPSTVKSNRKTIWDSSKDLFGGLADTFFSDDHFFDRTCDQETDGRTE